MSTAEALRQRERLTRDLLRAERAVELDLERDDDVVRTNVERGRPRCGLYTAFIQGGGMNRVDELCARRLADDQPMRLDEEHRRHSTEHDADRNRGHTVERRQIEPMAREHADER